MDPNTFFSHDYLSSREKFLSIVRSLGQSCESFVNPLVGPLGEELATDTVLVGKPNADKLIVIVSGTHGLEALAGSGVQIGLLQRMDISSLGNTAILLVHALNPWGAAYRRRQNENNVDVNRNFLSFSDPLFDNVFYDSLHPIITAADLFVDWKRNPRVDQEIEKYIDDYGDAAFHTALFQGQSRYADGVGYCGNQPTWSNLTIREICRRHGVNRQQVAVVDLHTGLGPHGDCTLLHPHSEDSSDHSMVEDWFGPNTVSVCDDRAMPYVPVGDMMSALPFEFDKQANVISVALEFGTYSTDQLMQLQINDSWLQNFGDESSAHGKRMKQLLQDFFFPDSSDWRQRIVSRSAQVLSKLVEVFRY